MPASHSAELTQLLLASSRGESDASIQLLDLIYDDLRALARRQIGFDRRDQTLSATALVNEAYLKLMEKTGVSWNDRQHFFRMIAQAMRHISVDYARQKLSNKRGGDQQRVELLDLPENADDQHSQMILELDDALSQLEALDKRLLEIVECRFFAGFSDQQTAEILNTSRRTVQRSWDKAKEILKEFLAPPG